MLVFGEKKLVSIEEKGVEEEKGVTFAPLKNKNMLFIYVCI